MLRKIEILFNWIRGYCFGDPARNGEYHFLRSYITDGMVIFDVGANVGEFTAYLFSLGAEVKVHCFEPVALTFERLKQRFAQHPGRTCLVLNPIGLSDRPGLAKIKIYGDYAGSNSLYDRSVIVRNSAFKEEDIVLTTLDVYLAENSVERIDLLKIDVEGHELKVLKGAVGALASRRVKCIQFEYGGCFLDSGTTLEQVYTLLRHNGYKLFRLWPYGRLGIRSFHPHLENYQYSNWLAMLT